jgi:hypothetical protein
MTASAEPLQLWATWDCHEGDVAFAVTAPSWWLPAFSSTAAPPARTATRSGSCARPCCAPTRMRAASSSTRPASMPTAQASWSAGGAARERPRGASVWAEQALRGKVARLIRFAHVMAIGHD